MRPDQARSPKLPTTALYGAAVACAIGVAAVGYFALNRPLTNWRQDQARKANLVRTKLAEGPALRARHAEQELELANLLARVEDVNRRVPDQPREGEFLADLSELAETHRVTIEDFRRGATTENETHSVVTVSINARGTHADLCGLLDAIARLPRLAELTELRVQSDENENDNGYPAQLTYALYYGMSAPTDDATTL